MKFFTCMIFGIILTIFLPVFASEYHFSSNIPGGVSVSNSTNFVSYNVIGHGLIGISKMSDSNSAGFVYLIRQQGSISSVEDEYSNPENGGFKVSVENPVHQGTKLTFITSNPDYYTIDIVDLSGNKIFELSHGEKIYSEKDYFFDISTFSAGTYFLTIHNSKISKSIKLLIIK